MVVHHHYTFLASDHYPDEVKPHNNCFLSAVVYHDEGRTTTLLYKKYIHLFILSKGVKSLKCERDRQTRGDKDRLLY